MSTQYEICGEHYIIDERSSRLELCFGDKWISISNEDFTKMIIRQIEVLSYVVEDPIAVLERFNVNYGDSK